MIIPLIHPQHRKIITDGNAAQAAKDFSALENVCQQLASKLASQANLAPPLVTFLAVLANDQSRYRFVAETFAKIPENALPTEHRTTAVTVCCTIGMSGKLKTKEASGALINALRFCSSRAASEEIMEQMLILSDSVHNNEAHHPLAALLEVSRPDRPWSNPEYLQRGLERLDGALYKQEANVRIASCRYLLSTSAPDFKGRLLDRMLNATWTLETEMQRRVMVGVVDFVEDPDNPHLRRARQWLDLHLQRNPLPQHTTRAPG